MKFLVPLITVWVMAAAAYAQESADEDADFERLTDDLLAARDDNMNYEDLYENMVQILSSPLDLNTVSTDELRCLHLLTDVQIENFLAYRRHQGRLLDLHELQVIPGFDEQVAAKLLPFVKVNARVDKSLLTRMFSQGNNYLVTRYERTLRSDQYSGDESRFAGSADKIYLRFRSAIAGDYSLGFTGEKDAGEKMLFDPRNHQLGFDFTSCHLQLRNKGKVKNIIAGDFQSQFGQGLILGGAFGLGKGAESVSTVRKSNVGFQPYTSINEGAYQRGLAVSFSLGEWITVSTFYSRARRDALSAEGSDSLAVTSFHATGYHRTGRELMDRKKVTEQNTGIVIRFDNNKADAGVIINTTDFDIPVIRTQTLYNKFAFRGSRNLNAGIFLNYRLGNVSFFNEIAHSFPGGTGGIAGLLISAHTNLELAIVYRNYMRNFYTFYGNAFSENTQPQNERAVYWGWKHHWSRRHTLNGYVDLFSFPWLAFRRYAPSHGYEWMLRTNYQPRRNISLSILCREESKARNTTKSTNIYGIEPYRKVNILMQCDYGIGGSLRLKFRVQYNRHESGLNATEGWALVQDVSVSSGRFQFTGRHGLFDTEHYDNRQYIYEQDAWSSYSLPAYAGVGVRNYALIEYKVTKEFTLWVRYARTRMLTGGEIDVGRGVIEGNTKNDIKFQARLKF